MSKILFLANYVGKCRNVPFNLFKWDTSDEAIRKTVREIVKDNTDASVLSIYLSSHEVSDTLTVDEIYDFFGSLDKETIPSVNVYERKYVVAAMIPMTNHILPEYPACINEDDSYTKCEYHDQFKCSSKAVTIGVGMKCCQHHAKIRVDYFI